MQEVLGGAPGDATITLLRRLAWQYTRSPQCTFPPYEGRPSWDAAAVDELLCRMFDREDSKNPGHVYPFLVKCLAAATDGPSFERLLLKAIQNFLKDEAKATHTGKLRRRLDRLLTKADGFEQTSDGWWSLSEHRERVWQGDLSALYAAAHAVRGVEVTRWNSAGPTPKPSEEAILSVVMAVLETVRGSVRTQDLALVLQQRFWLLADPEERAVPLRASHFELSDGGDEPASAEFRAREIFESLDPREQALVPVLHDPRRWAAACQTGQFEADVCASALKERLRLAARDDEDQDALIAHLLHLHEAEMSLAPTEPTEER